MAVGRCRSFIQKLKLKIVTEQQAIELANSDKYRSLIGKWVRLRTELDFYNFGNQNLNYENKSFANITPNRNDQMIISVEPIESAPNNWNVIVAFKVSHEMRDGKYIIFDPVPLSEVGELIESTKYVIVSYPA